MREIFAMIEQYVAIDFVEVPETSGTVGSIRFGFSGSVDSDTYAQTYPLDGDFSSAQTTNAYPNAGDIWLNVANVADFDSTPGSNDYHTLIHEIGHALGLKHPFEKADTFPLLPETRDSYEDTVMSYSALAGKPYSAMSTFPETLMPLDIAALQLLYGATEHNPGNDVYAFLASQTYNETLWDTGGIDTISGASTSSGVTIDLTPGGWLAVGLPIAYRDSDGNSLKQTRTETVAILEGVIIENAIGGTGNDILRGNDADNRLSGGAGSDTLTGGAGADVFEFNHMAKRSVDRIVDFNAADGDRLAFDPTVFTALAEGVTANNLVIGKTKAHDPDDYLLLARNGKLYFDPDGNGSAKAILLAGIKGGALPDFTDFEILSTT